MVPHEYSLGSQTILCWRYVAFINTQIHMKKIYIYGRTVFTNRINHIHRLS